MKKDYFSGLQHLQNAAVSLMTVHSCLGQMMGVLSIGAF